jgi:hypothetical protein
MTPNELLLWLSARKEGSWRQFRTAVEALDLADSDEEGEENGSLRLHLRIQLNLSRLGHVEFNAAECENGWRVVPPALALSQRNGHITGVLCGARTPKLLERIERSASGMRWDRTEQADCPNVVCLHAATEQTLIDLARGMGILCQPNAPAALLSHLPSVASLAGFRRERLPASGQEWDVQHFVIERKVIKWHAITLQEANASDAQGLFRFTRYQMPRYYLREGRDTIALPDAVGKYYLLSRRTRRVLKYDRNERSLTIPAIFRPPLLTERALILCSGFPPSFSVVRGRPTLTYRDVPEEIAGMTAEILRQDIL